MAKIVLLCCDFPGCEVSARELDHVSVRSGGKTAEFDICVEHARAVVDLFREQERVDPPTSPLRGLARVNRQPARTAGRPLELRSGSLHRGPS